MLQQAKAFSDILESIELLYKNGLNSCFMVIVTCIVQALLFHL